MVGFQLLPSLFLFSCFFSSFALARPITRIDSRALLDFVFICLTARVIAYLKTLISALLCSALLCAHKPNGTNSLTGERVACEAPCHNNQRRQEW